MAGKSSRSTRTSGVDAKAEEASESTTATESPAPVSAAIPEPEPRKGPQQERRARAEFHVKSGVSQIVHVAGLGNRRALEDIVEKLLRRAYGLE